MPSYTSHSMTQAPQPAPRRGVFSRLYTGTGAFDIVGKRKRWYRLFGLLVVICIVSMAIKGFNLSIEFVGGTQIQFPAAGLSAEASTDRVNQVVGQALGEPAKSVQRAGTGAAETIVVRTETLTGPQQFQVRQALFDAFHPRGPHGQPSVNSISQSAVSSSWGGEITTQALIALAVFLVLVSLFLALYFERAMALAA